jgi:hypothetical protein
MSRDSAPLHIPAPRDGAVHKGPGAFDTEHAPGQREVRVKRLLIVAAVVALTLAAAPVAFAGHHQGGPSTKAKGKAFVCQGKVVAVDVTAKKITLKVWSGNRGLRRYHGKDLVVQVADTTRIVRRAFGEATVVILADVKAGERIWVNGTADRSNPNTTVYNARTIRLQATWPFSVKGTVQSLDPVGLTVTVKIDHAMKAMKPLVGDEVTFQTTVDTIFMKWVDGVCTPITFADLAVNDKVRVGGTVDNTAAPDKQFIAKRITVKD